MIDPRIAIRGLGGAGEVSDVVLRSLGPRIDGADRVERRFKMRFARVT